MESQPVGKRKIRKTRKCLDELRKRSHTNHPASSKHNVIKVNTNCVTLNRLTLLYPKAVRSETITRPILAEIKNNPNVLLDDVVRGKNLNISCTSDVKRLEINNTDVHNNCHTSSRENEMEVSYSLKSVSYNIRDQADKSSDSYFMFSPIHQTEVKHSDSNKVVTNPVTTTAPCSQDNYGYSLYKECMNDISTYLKQNSSDLIKENVMNVNKSLLESIYFNDNNKQKCRDILKYAKRNVTLKNNSITPRETIMQNPVEYIRQAQLGYASTETQNRREHRESLSDITSTPSTSFATNSLHESTSLSTSIVIYDTPEYIYYPHKLNQ